MDREPVSIVEDVKVSLVEDGASAGPCAWRKDTENPASGNISVFIKVRWLTGSISIMKSTGIR